MKKKPTKKRWYLLIFMLGWGALTILPLAIYGSPMAQIRTAISNELSRQTKMHCHITDLGFSFTNILVEQISFAATADAPTFCTVETLTIAIDYQMIVALLTGDTVAIFKSFAAQNITIKMNEVQLLVAAITGKSSENGFTFAAAGNLENGKFTANGKLHLFAQADGAQQIEIGLHLEKIPLPIFYRLFPQALAFLQKQGSASGELDLTYSWQNDVTAFSFSGAVRTENVIAFLFNQAVPLPASTWNFSGSYAQDKLILDKFALQGERDNFLLVGEMDFANDKQIFRLESEGLSWALVCHVAGNRTLGEYFGGLLSFRGFIASEKNQVEISGHGGSKNLIPLLAPFAVLKTLSIKSDFAYKSTDKIIRLDNIHGVTESGQAAGMIHFPWLQELNQENFICDLALESDLSPLGSWLNLPLTGKVAGNVSVKTNNDGMMTYTTELRGIEEVSAKINDDNFSLGKFDFQLKVNSFWHAQNHQHQLEKIVLRSIPLNGALNGAYANNQLSLGYNLQIQPSLLMRFLPPTVREKINANTWRKLSLRGLLTLSPEQILQLAQTEWRGEFLPNNNANEIWQYLLTGNPQLQLHDGNYYFALNDGALAIKHGEQPQLNLTFKSNRPINNDKNATAANAPITPTTTITDLTLQSDIEVLKNLTAMAGATLPPFLATLTGDGVAINARITQPANAPTEYQIALNAAMVKFAQISIPLTLQGIFYDARNFSDEIICKKIIIADREKNFNVKGSGKISQLANPQLDFTLAAVQNIAPSLTYFNIPLPLKISGLLNNEITIDGALSSPSIKFAADAPDLVLDGGTFVRKLITPKISGEINYHYATATNEITQIKLNNFAVQTPDFLWRANAAMDEFTIIRDEKNPYINFGKNAMANYQLNGKRQTLAWLVPDLTAMISGDNDHERSLICSGKVRAEKLPLNFADDYQWLNHLQVDESKLTVDQLLVQKLTVKNVTVPYSLANGKFIIADGYGEFGGKFIFNGEVDFTKKPVAGNLAFNADNLQVAEILPPISATTKIISGAAFIPALAGKRFLRTAWQGVSVDEILDSLTIPEMNLRVDDLKLQSVKQKINWREILKHDFHQSIADEIAKHLEARSAAEVNKIVVMWLQQVNLNGKITNRCWEIQNSKISGGDTADLLISGKVFFNRKVELRVYPIAHLDRHFDSEDLTSQPLVRALIESLPAEKKAAALKIVPNWLNQLGAEKKLYLDILGTLDNLEIDPQGMREGIKANLPALMAQVTQLAGQSAILKGVLNKSGIPLDQDGKLKIDLDELFK